MKRKTIIIASALIFSILIISLFVLANRPTDPEYTGGSGTPEKGSLILRGYEVKSNDKSKISLGTFFSTTQQKNIRSFLAVQLFNKKPQPEYIGNVIPGSVDVDYQKSIVQFKVKIEDPETTYTVRYNTINDDMSVTGEDGKTITPPNQ